jgi:hypothetical protein
MVVTIAARELAPKAVQNVFSIASSEIYYMA